MNINKTKDMTPFDMQKNPCKQNPLLMPLVWGASYITTLASKIKIDRSGIEGLKPPFLVLAEHQGYTDYYIAPLALFPHRANYVSDMEGFAAFGKFLYRQVGCVPTRRYTADITLIKNIEHVVNKNGIIVIFPEARHSNVGTNSIFPSSVGKLVKRLKLPTVLLKSHGSYLTSPIWDEENKRTAPLSATLSKVFSCEDTLSLTTKEITKKLNDAFSYDEYKWQYNNKVSISYPKRAEGLHKVLYRCIYCNTDYSMTSQGKFISCNSCGASWEMSEYGQLISGMSNEALHIPDWYEWQRAEVQNEIANTVYSLNETVYIEALPNEKGFVPMGEGSVIQSKEGFKLMITKTKEEHFFSAKSLWSLHTEYNYKGKGDCIVLSTKDCCYYLYFKAKSVNVTKIQFATEEYHRLLI